LGGFGGIGAVATLDFLVLLHELGFASRLTQASHSHLLCERRIFILLICKEIED
jgi:hypothetical protein